MEIEKKGKSEERINIHLKKVAEDVIRDGREIGDVGEIMDG